MKTVARTTLMLLLAAVLVSPAMAAQKKKKKRKKKQRKARVVSIVRLPRAVLQTLTTEQKTQIAAINKEYGPKVVELTKKQNSVVTAEQRKARRDAFLAARKAGKKGKELRQAADEAAKITDEQKKQMAEIGKQLRSLRQEAQKKAVALLTDEQKSKLRGGGKKKGKKKRKKKNA